MSDLVRFHLDPRLLRIGVRRHACGQWLATIRRRDGSYVTLGLEESPRKAVILAFNLAAGLVDGCDPWLEWTYHHPWGEQGAAAHDERERLAAGAARPRLRVLRGGAGPR